MVKYHKPSPKPSKDICAAVSLPKPTRSLLFKVGLFIPFPPPKREAQRSAGEPESLPQPVGNVPLIGKMDPLRSVSEDNEIRRFCSHLGSVVEFDPPALEQWRMVGCGSLREDPVQLGGGHPPGVLGHDVVHLGHDLAEPLAGQCGDENDGGKGEVFELRPDT